MKSQKGFSYIIVIIALAVVSFVGFAGWRVYDSNKSQDNTVSNSTTQAAQSQSAGLESAADVAAAEEELKAIDIDNELNTAELEANLSELQ